MAWCFYFPLHISGNVRRTDSRGCLLRSNQQQQKSSPSTPGAGSTAASANRGIDPQRQTFLEKLQASIKVRQTPTALLSK